MKTNQSFHHKQKRMLTISGLLTLVLIFISSALPAQKLTDAEIASAAVTANQIDIDAARIAKGISKNAEVLRFADLMIKDHEATIKESNALTKKLNIMPAFNDVTQKLIEDAEDSKKSFISKTGADFDKAYIDNEVKMHKKVINMVENDLIPQAQNAELKEMLQKKLPTLREHLQQAENLQKTLDNK